MKKVSYKSIIIVSVLFTIVSFLLALLIIGVFIKDPNAWLMSLFIALIVFAVIFTVYYIIESNQAKKFNNYYNTLKHKPDDVIDAVFETTTTKDVGQILFYRDRLLFVSFNKKEPVQKEYMYQNIRNIKKVNLRTTFKYGKDEIIIASADFQTLGKYF